MGFLFLVGCLVQLVTGNPFSQLSNNDFVSVRNQLVAEYNRAFARETGGTAPLPASFPACIVRLAFHDCGTWDSSSKTGGCHAHLFQACPGSSCENNAAENAGLDECTGRLEQMYQDTTQSTVPANVMSRADFWALAAATAIDYTSGSSCVQSNTWRWGRTDANVPKSFPGRLPGGQDSIDTIQGIFVTRMGFTITQMIALFGAHSLGGAKPQNSGFNGQWVSRGRNFSNIYYQILTEHPWHPQSLGGTKRQWQSTDFNDNTIMLDTDLAPMWNIATSACPSQKITLDSSGCPLTSNSGILDNFASNNAAFCQAFSGAFKKMQEFGGDTYKSVGAGAQQQPAIATTTTITSSTNVNSISASQPITLTATLTINDNTGYGGTPIGTVTFFDNGVALGSAVTLQSGTASASVTITTTGSHSITAVYTPRTGTSFVGSTSSALGANGNNNNNNNNNTNNNNNNNNNNNGNKATTLTLSSSTNPATLGQGVTFSILVAATGGGIPTGNVQFFVDGIINNIAPLSTDGSVILIGPISQMPVGTHNISALYLPNNQNFITSFSSLSQVIGVVPISPASTPAPTSPVSTPPPPNNGNVATSVSVTFTSQGLFTAAVTSRNGVPTGTVTWVNDDSITLSSSQVNNGIATINRPQLGNGLHTLRADFTGTNGFQSSSNSVRVRVTLGGGRS